MIANELARYPPTSSININNKQTEETNNSFFLAINAYFIFYSITTLVSIAHFPGSWPAFLLGSRDLLLSDKIGKKGESFNYF